MAYKRDQERHARKVDHIVTFCAGVLAAEGPAALEPNTIGRRIDGSGYNLSNLFPNRAVVLALVLDRHWDGLLAAVGQPSDWAGTPRDRILAMATAYLERVDATRGVHAVLPDCRRFLLPAARDAHAVRRRWLVDALRSALEEAAPSRAPHAGRVLAESLLSMLDGWVAWAGEVRAGPAEYAEVAVGMVTGRRRGGASPGRSGVAGRGGGEALLF